MEISKKLTVYLALAAVLATAAACKKTAANADLTGTWQLVNVKLKEKTVYGKNTPNGSPGVTYALNSYTTVKNAGTLTFSADSTITSGGLTFSAPDDNQVYFTALVNGENIYGNWGGPFLFVAAQSNLSKDTYKVAGDSVFFYYPFLDNFPADPSSSLHAPLSNFKFQVSGNTLTLTTNVSQDSASFLVGGLFSFKSEGTGTITLQR